MNELMLTEQLRALRQPPPDSGFEARLEQALAREAQALRGSGVVVPFRAARRLRRWSGRVGLGVALALGATAAAAAAGGIWALVVIRAETAPTPSATPAAERATAPRTTAPKAPAILPTEPAPAAPEPQASPLPEQPPLPAIEVPRAGERKAIRPEVPARAERARAAEAPRTESEAMVPFELPTPRNGVASGSPESAGVEQAARVTSERRALPEVPARSERAQGRPERTERDKNKDKKEKDKDKAWPPGREIARERSGLDRAERGLERAGEARGRNKE